MPANNDKAGSAAQPDPNAQTTEQQQPVAENPKSQIPNPRENSSSKSQTSSLMDKLGIPAEIQSQIKPKADVGRQTSDVSSEAEGGEQPLIEQGAEGELPVVGEQQTPNAERPAPNEENAEVEAEVEGEELPEAEIQAPQGRKLTKEQKRINKLVRQRNEAERAAEAAAAENQQYREYFAKQQQSQADANAVPVPGASGPLARVATEPQLNTEVSRAKALREWCDANADGVAYTKDGKEEFVSPQEVAGYRREADKILTDAPERRDQIRGFAQAQQAYNQAAYTAMPQLFDRQSEEHQLAVSILQELPPQARSHPGINLFLADWVRGFQSRQAEQKAAQPLNGSTAQPNGTRKRAIDDLAFKPRVPLAPHTDITTSRGSGPSPQKKLNEAMSTLVAEGGGVEHLKAALRARDEVKGNQAQSQRRPVTV